MSNSKLILKNTLFLYIRMFVTMGVSLFTSRLILEALGISDYGIYSVVGGIVSLFGFFNSAMSSATQRYLAFDLGQNNSERLNKTFNTTIIIHIAIAIVILLLCEVIGLWYLNNKLNFDESRIGAANWVFQFSIFTALVSVMQVPYNALIIAKERMNVFALMSVLDVTLKLLIVYLLMFFRNDKLIIYSFLVFVVTLLMAFSYRWYCYKFFKESKFKIYYDKSYYLELIKYSGWNLFGNIAVVSKGQGVNIVLNLFFGTIVNAAYGITMQVQGAITVFVNSIQMAINPQIIKNYSQEKYHETYKLIFQATKFSYYLMLIIIIPIFLNTDYILTTWLKTPPNFTFTFIKLALINILIECLSGPLMTGAQASGRIKWYQIVVGALVFFNLPISYLLLKKIREPEIVFYVSIGFSILSYLFRSIFLKYIILFPLRMYFGKIISRILIITAINIGICYLIDCYLKFPPFINLSLSFVIILISNLCLILLLGLTKNERQQIFMSIQCLKNIKK